MGSGAGGTNRDPPRSGDRNGLPVAAIADAARPPITFRLVGLLALCAVIATVVAGAIAVVLARQSDRQAHEQQRQALVHAIGEHRTIFADFTVRRATDLATFGWSRGVAKREDLEAALTPSGLTRYRHERALLIRNDGSVAAAFPPEATAVPAAVKSLIAEFQADAAMRQGIAAQSELFGSITNPVATDFVVVRDRPAIVAVALVHTLGEPGRAPGAPAFLASIAALDLHMLDALEATAGLKALAFSTDPPVEREIHTLTDRNGRIVGWASWEAEHRTLAAVAKLAPVLGGVAICLFGLAGLSAWQWSRSTRELAHSERRALRLAHEDAITKLPNRRRILEVVEQMLAARPPRGTVAFAFLDLDGFKEVNDTIGHHGGDQLLAAVAARLQASMPAGAAIGRLGSDEFALIMAVDDPARAHAAAAEAVAAVGRPFWMNGQSVQIGVSIGMVMAPHDGTTRDELTRRADLALSAAKRAGRGRVMTFAPAMEEEHHHRRFIKRELRRALADEALTVHYQPIVAADGGGIVGVEALVRWDHPARGRIPPSVFIPVAEQTGLMEALGEFVLRRALADAMNWPSLYVAVNLSPVQMRSPALVGVIGAVLAETGIASSRVVLEITEGVLIDNPDEAAKRLDQLRALGVRIALDDFGVGYSSLSYLQRFPLDKLKIDKGFVDPLGHSGNAAVIVQAIVALGRAFGLRVLAEGVESEEQRVLLRLAGCDEMQGFLFSQPVPREMVDMLVREEQGAGAVHRLAPAPNGPESGIPLPARAL